MPYNPGRLPDIVDIRRASRKYVEEELDKSLQGVQRNYRGGADGTGYQAAGEAHAKG